MWNYPNIESVCVCACVYLCMHEFSACDICVYAGLVVFPQLLWLPPPCCLLLRQDFSLTWNTRGWTSWLRTTILPVSVSSALGLHVHATRGYKYKLPCPAVFLFFFFSTWFVELKLRFLCLWCSHGTNWTIFPAKVKQNKQQQNKQPWAKQAFNYVLESGCKYRARCACVGGVLT